MSTQGDLGKVICDKLDIHTYPVSQVNGSIPTLGSEGNLGGNERLSHMQQ